MEIDTSLNSTARSLRAASLLPHHQKIFQSNSGRLRQFQQSHSRSRQPRVSRSTECAAGDGQHAGPAGDDQRRNGTANGSRSHADRYTRMHHLRCGAAAMPRRTCTCTCNGLIDVVTVCMQTSQARRVAAVALPLLCESAMRRQGATCLTYGLAYHITHCGSIESTEPPCHLVACLASQTRSEQDEACDPNTRDCQVPFAPVITGNDGASMPQLVCLPHSSTRDLPRQVMLLWPADADARMGDQLQEVQWHRYCSIIHPWGQGPRWQRSQATAVHLSHLSRCW